MLAVEAGVAYGLADQRGPPARLVEGNFMADVQFSAKVPLPRRRHGATVGFVVGGTEGHLVTAALPDGRLSDMHLSVDKQGSTLAGMTEALSIALTAGLQAGAPLSAFVEELRATRYPPAGPTDDPDIPEATSLGDYLARRLDIDYPAGWEVGARRATALQQ